MSIKEFVFKLTSLNRAKIRLSHNNIDHRANISTEIISLWSYKTDLVVFNSTILKRLIFYHCQVWGRINKERFIKAVNYRGDTKSVDYFLSVIFQNGGVQKGNDLIITDNCVKSLSIEWGIKPMKTETLLEIRAKVDQ